MVEADASHAFHATTQRLQSRTATPRSTASNSLHARSFWVVSSIRGQRGFTCCSCDEFAQQNLQRLKRGQVHQQGDVALDIALSEGKIDVNEQYEIAGLWRRREAEQRRAVAAKDLGQGYHQSPLQQVRDGGEAAVQNDVAGLGERFMLEFENVFEWQVSARDRANQFETACFRKDQKRATMNVPVEHLVHRDESVGFILTQGFYRPRARDQVHPRHGQQHLLAGHFPQAERRLADAEVDELGQRVELKFVQRGRRFCVHVAPARICLTAPARKSLSAGSVSGLERKVAPTALARSMISCWWLAEITATGIVGRIRRTSAAISSPSLPGMLKSTTTRSGFCSSRAASASSALAASTRVQSG